MNYFGSIRFLHMSTTEIGLLYGRLGRFDDLERMLERIRSIDPQITTPISGGLHLSRVAVAIWSRPWG